MKRAVQDKLYELVLSGKSLRIVHTSSKEPSP